MKSILSKKPFFSDPFNPSFSLFSTVLKNDFVLLHIRELGYPPFSDFKATDFPSCRLLLDFAVKYLYLEKSSSWMN